MTEGGIPLSEGRFRTLERLNAVSAGLAAVPCFSVLEYGRALDALWSTASTRCPGLKF